MTVKELKDVLEKADENLEVYLRDSKLDYVLLTNVDVIEDADGEYVELSADEQF